MVCAVSQNMQHFYYFVSYQGGVVMATSLWYLDLLVQSVPIIYHCYINQSTILGNYGLYSVRYSLSET
jgi:hypothetical protein